MLIFLMELVFFCKKIIIRFQKKKKKINTGLYVGKLQPIIKHIIIIIQLIFITLYNYNNWGCRYFSVAIFLTKLLRLHLKITRK